MSAGKSLTPRLRSLLDCLLVLILLLLIAAPVAGAQNAGAHNAGAHNTGAQNAGDQAKAGALRAHNQPAPAQALPDLSPRMPADNTTLAAINAAQHAALMLPQYLTSLPVLTR